MTKAIYIIGPSSTGKTTLCDVLARRLGLVGPAYITEVARQVMKAKGYTRNDVGHVQMQIDILEEHLKREEKSTTFGVILCDRSAVDPVVYSQLTSETDLEAKRRLQLLTANSAFQRALARYRSPSSTVILLAPVKEWVVDDGVRSLEQQDRCLQIYKELLRGWDIPYKEFGSETRFLYERMVLTLGLSGF
ncbi:hypothetical protein FA15DRAFT_674563, partial [Coprinopsis marcescibilis]